MKKKSSIVIVLFLIVLITIILLSIYFVKSKSSNKNDVIKSNIELAEPKVELSIEPNDRESEIVTIYIKSIENSKIETITLPDGKVVTSSEAKYKVTKNGEYSFIVKSNKGISVTKTITIDNIKEISSNKPYIPDGFTHIDGTEVDTGYVIQDSRGNQFVWVPVSTGSLIRNTDGNDEYAEIDNTATGLYNSVSKYYGFYIARYEASKTEIEGESVAASQYGTMPWTNVEYNEAYEAAQKAGLLYGYSEVRTAIVNSYAWDTTLEWINESFSNYSTNTNYGNYTGVVLETGTTSNDEVNSICDLAGNLREWTTEIYYPNIFNDNKDELDNTIENGEQVENLDNYRVIRGGSANLNKVASSHTGNPETMSDAYWGFRMILYKE